MPGFAIFNMAIYMQNTENNTPAGNEQDISAVRKILRFAAFPIAAIAGFLVTHTEIRGAANKTALQDGTFKDIFEENDAARRPNIMARIKNEITQEQFLERENTIRDRYRATADARMEHMGHGGFWEKFAYVSRSNAQKAVIDGLTVGGVTFGALLALSSNSIMDKLTPGHGRED